MLLASISMVFALIFGTMAYRGIPHGWALTRVGWDVLQTTANKPDTQTDVEQRRILSEGNRFFLAGLGWLIGGILSAIAAILAVVAIPFILGLL